MTELAPPYPLQLPAEAFASIYRETPRRFLAQHSGYSRIRPAFLPMVVPGETARAMREATVDCLRAVTDRVVSALAGGLRELLQDLAYPREEAAWLSSMADRAALHLGSLFARADFVIGARGPRLVELNVGPTVGGIGILDRYADVATRLLRDHAPEVVVEFPRPARAWARTLRRALPICAGPRSDRPRLTLVVPDEDIDLPIPYDAAHFLAAEGIDAAVVPTSHVRFDGALAFAGDDPVDVVYGCFTYEEAAAPKYRGFVDSAMRYHAVGGPPYVAPPVFTLLGNKAMLADLSRTGVSPYLATTWPADRAALREARRNRADLVLKPAVGYGGKDVVIGRACTDEEWGERLDAAGASPRPYVLQEYVEPAAIPLPTPGAQGQYEVSAGCLVVGGEFAGFLLRYVPAGTGGVVNVSRGAVFGAACEAVAAVLDGRGAVAGRAG